MLELTEDQVLWFRARRTHLAGPGGDDVRATAYDILGAQAQQEAAGLLALCLRTKGRPTADEIRPRLHDDGRDLVRVWGQRGTLHVYDAEADWTDIISTGDDLMPPGRQGGMPTKALVNKAGRHLLKAGKPISREAFFDMIPDAYLRELEQHPGAGKYPLRLGAGRLLWCLTLRGDACLGHKEGAEQTYVARPLWFADLPFELDEPVEAAARLSARYLAAFGPATPADVAHYFGARVREARTWLARLEEQDLLEPVVCGDRKGMLALREDLDELDVTPPRGADWPTRLLPLWDTMLMAHADRSWLIDETEKKRVWRPGAYVASTVIARGRIVATWSMKPKSKHLEVTVEPLSEWRARRDGPAVRRDAADVAAHLGLEAATVLVA